ncbi:SUN domain-containing ossification factor [Pholidichthys leucotaenia]
MKMSQLRWRTVSLWLCVAAVAVVWYSSCQVCCTESNQDVPKAPTTQGFSSEEELVEKSHHHQVEENSVLPTHLSSDRELQVAEGHEKENQISEEMELKQQVFDAEEPVVEVDVEEADKQAEKRSDDQRSETPLIPDQDPSSPLPRRDSVSGFSAENEESSSFNLPDSLSNGVVDGVSHVAATEVSESDLPPADCEEEDNPFDHESNPPIVLENTSNAHTTGTKTHVDPSLISPTPPPHSTQHVEANMSHPQPASSPAAADTDSSVSGKDPEDIPTFDEWKRKVMEVEKEKTQSTHTSTNGGSHTVKKVQKNFNNYASVECGAKILGSNPEAKSTSAILMENMDLYMLNPCSNKIWFIIELCEPVQVKQLDIANFELFSSTPKDFLVSISDRYPTNKWLKLGTFHARDERTVQSFPLDEHLYAKYVKMFTKYIKVELLSHFGSEHFCPLSLIRVFGTSMVEEYEEIAEPPERAEDPDDDLDYHSGLVPGENNLSQNLIGSATDAIMNMVNNLAVNVLGGGPEVQGNLSSHDMNMTEPSEQLEVTAETPTTNRTSVQDTEDTPIPSDLDVPETVTPPSEKDALETSTTADESEQDLPPVEEEKKDDEAPISSTIILLGEEEESEEVGDKKEPQEPPQENPSMSPSSFSCAASLREYLLHRCLTKKRKCQTAERKKTIPPVPFPSWQLLPQPSACPEPQQQPRAEEASEPAPESRSTESEGPEAPGDAVESGSDPLPPFLLEPSQTLNLPDSSTAKASPAVPTPQLSSEELTPKKIQDVSLKEENAESSASLTASIHLKPTAAPDDALDNKPDDDVSQREVNAPIQAHDETDQPSVLLPTSSPHSEHARNPADAPPEDAAEGPHLGVEPEPPIMDVKADELADDVPAPSGENAPSPRPSSPTPSPSISDIYAEPPNGTEQNGNPVHGSSQKESVFMRLNNRIKALEMNMSLSSRYLEQLSQRYRKQMEEMQKAFNKTIIKLQNTSRIAEEQDQRQTESIQLLQGQLKNVTQLVLNLSIRVGQLQSEVSDRQNYLLLSLGLCACLGLLLCANHCRLSPIPPTAEPEPPTTKNYTYCCPERQLSCSEESGLKRRVSYPLINSIQLASTEGPEMLHAEETQNLCPANRKRRRRKMKTTEKVETLKPSLHSAPELCNGAIRCNGEPVTTNPPPLTNSFLQPTFRDSPSEGGSEGSSHSDDPSFCGITTACSRICDGLPPPKTRAEKRALRRRRPKPACAVVDVFHAPQRGRSDSLPISTIEDIMGKRTQQSCGTFMPLSGSA